MSENSYAKKWCPLGRLSVQRIVDKGIEVVPAGAYNQALVQPSPRDPGTKIYPSTMCSGSVCVFYRRGLNPWGWGYCAIAPQRVGKYIVLAAALLAMSYYGARWFLG